MTVKITDRWQFMKAIFVLLVVMFSLGITMGACSLGMKLPIALFDLATGQSAAR